MDGAQCRGLVEQTCPSRPALGHACPRLAADTAAEGGSLWTTLSLVEWGHPLRAHQDTVTGMAAQPPHPPTEGRVEEGFFLFSFFFFPAAHIFCSDKHSLEQCGRVCRPSQRRIRKSLTWSKNIVKKEQTAQSGNDLVNGSAGGGLEWVRVFSV